MPENENSANLSQMPQPMTEYPEPLPDGLQNGVDPETIQEVIALSVGNYVVVEFLIGTNNIVRKEGVLTAVGVSWLLLYDEASGTSVVCDMYSVKFVTYFDPGKQTVPSLLKGAGGRFLWLRVFFLEPPAQPSIGADVVPALPQPPDDLLCLQVPPS